jgi:ankyrin repeat protein
VNKSDGLSTAAFDGDLDAVARLLDAGGDIAAPGSFSNPLHAAIESDNAACVQLLIRRGANVERCDGELSSLAHAVDSSIQGTIQDGGNPGDEPTEIISLLLEAGADPATGLQLARDYASTKIVNLLTAAIMRRRRLPYGDSGT